MSAVKDALLEQVEAVMMRADIPTTDDAAFTAIMSAMLEGPCCAECATFEEDRAPGETFDTPWDVEHVWAWLQDQAMLAGVLAWLDADSAVR